MGWFLSIVVIVVIIVVIVVKRRNIAIQKTSTAKVGYQVAIIKPKDEILAAINNVFAGWNQVNGSGSLNLLLPNNGTVVEFYIFEVGNALYSLKMRAVNDVPINIQIATFPLWYDLMKKVDKNLSK